MANQKKNQQQNGAMMPIIIALVALLVIVLAVAAAILIPALRDGTFSAGDETTAQTSAETNASTKPTEGVAVDMTAVAKEINSMHAADFTASSTATEYVKITIAEYGDVIVRLRADVAPLTVKNFQKLVGEKFYDGLTFHRVMQDFMIQGGDPKGDGTGDAPNKIKGEFKNNGVTNNLGHIKGVISMARGSYSMDSASCQFFICNSDSTSVKSLDGSYASFGYVLAGMDIVDAVSAVEVDYDSTGREQSVPKEKITIESISFVQPKK